MGDRARFHTGGMELKLVAWLVWIILGVMLVVLVFWFYYEIAFTWIFLVFFGNPPTPDTWLLHLRLPSSVFFDLAVLLAWIKLKGIYKQSQRATQSVLIVCLLLAFFSPFLMIQL